MTHLIQRWRKKITIKRRAFERGCKLRDELGLLFIPGKKQNDVFRTLIRLQRIQCGKKPFAYVTGKMGTVSAWDNSDFALKLYGNLK